MQPQDTLYGIAWRYNLDYHDLARWNHVGPDYRIAVGQTLALAPTATPAPSRAPAPAKQAPMAVTPSPNSAAKWLWPTARIGVPRRVPSSGILLDGLLGQDVRATAPGRVVYAGTGIRGYGNLIIIKHGENLLSAYAHNRDSLVHDGEQVGAGQVIAHMGEGVPGTAVLYFEIRRNGKPVDPLPFLAQ